MKVKSKTSKKVRTPREGRVTKDLEARLRAATKKLGTLPPTSNAWLEALEEYERLTRKI